MQSLESRRLRERGFPLTESLSPCWLGELGVHAPSCTCHPGTLPGQTGPSGVRWSTPPQLTMEMSVHLLPVVILTACPAVAPVLGPCLNPCPLTVSHRSCSEAGLCSQLLSSSQTQGLGTLLLSCHTTQFSTPNSTWRFCLAPSFHPLHCHEPPTFWVPSRAHSHPQSGSRASTRR